MPFEPPERRPSLLGARPVKLLCEACGSTLESWRLDERCGELRRPTRGRVISSGPTHITGARGLPHVLSYKCKGKACARRCRVRALDVEHAVLAAIREGRTFVRIGEHIRGYASGDRLPDSRTAKAPIPGGYRRPVSRGFPPLN